jgi:two-component system, chemotaxis family, chemotaxis protein CheY
MKMSILLVDDCQIFREVASEALRSLGCDVWQAENGFDALSQMIEGLWPILIVTDLNMPRMGGIEFIRAVRKERSIPIVLCSSDDRAATLAAGLPDVIIVEKSIDELVSAVCSQRVEEWYARAFDGSSS